MLVAKDIDLTRLPGIERTHSDSFTLVHSGFAALINGELLLALARVNRVNRLFVTRPWGVPVVNGRQLTKGWENHGEPKDVGTIPLNVNLQPGKSEIYIGDVYKLTFIRGEGLGAAFAIQATRPLVIQFRDNQMGRPNFTVLDNYLRQLRAAS